MPRETSPGAAATERLGAALVATPLGTLALAASRLGVRALVFGDTDEQAQRLLAEALPGVVLVPDGPRLVTLAGPVLAWLDGGPVPHGVPLDPSGTAFQRSVWTALQAIPPGNTRTYGQLAAELDRPGAARAVGAACGANRIAVLIPCHRALGAGGRLVEFRWGLERKRWLLERERQPAANRAIG